MRSVEIERSVKELVKESEQLKERQQTLGLLIESYQKICEHFWVDAGHDSHYYYQKCKYCTLRRKV